MAKGDWGPGTRLQHPIMINIMVGEDGRVAHVGVGYHLRLPSGKVHPSGFSWDGHEAYVQPIVDELLEAAAEHEGAQPPVHMSDVEGSQAR